jgi:hypothetical protein
MTVKEKIRIKSREKLKELLLSRVPQYYLQLHLGFFFKTVRVGGCDYIAAFEAC